MCMYIYAGEHSVQAVVPDETNQHILLGTYTQPGDFSFLLSRVTRERVISHVRMHHVAHVHESGHAFTVSLLISRFYGVMSHENESCRTCK